MANLWRRTNPALFRDGYRTAFLQFGIAVLVHHIRRILVPWLGAWMYNDPLEGLRLARGNPEVFLDEMLDFSWPWLAFMYIQKWAFDLAGAYLAGLLVLTNGRLPWRFRAQPQASPLLPKRAMATAKVCYLAWMLACAEYMFARTLSTVSFGIAYAKLGLLSPANSANRAALDLVLRKHWSKAPLNACQLVAYTARGVIPMVVGAVANAARGRPGLLLALSTLGGGVWMVIRYRSRFFIALEMSSMFVVIGCAAVLFALLGREFVADPLGLGVSTAMARRSGNMLREAVQVERLKRAPAESVRVPP
ncbi:hypothetical protein UCRPA7_4223 [Phaeoacremonium minimum UCRPA7]|uniref:Uncharacterized protein n=1 Tax=Phaeoacremonium minimum (strain UCR-PA7) TaxID=1286976 RepID=R8BLS1_PHAM7|nr:hypothetical protein UCRPA7_4223 [Phaeoacremonium minimum UCRPA7]EOO00294.1 hypothetical protein UCRPA7_4223 [Phaeoacremonium minimum UCRPA7]